MNFKKSVWRLISSVTIAGAVSLAFAGSGHKAINLNSQQSKSLFESKLTQGHELFVQNKGQWSNKAQFLGQSPGVDTWLESQGMRFDYYKNGQLKGKSGRLGQVVDVQFAGANNFTYSAEGKAVHQAKYMTRPGHTSAVAGSYNSVLAKNVYNGINFQAHYLNGKIEYNWIVNPLANPSAIDLNFVGSFGITVNGSKLGVKTQIGTELQEGLSAYQWINGKKVSVAAEFAVDKSNHVSFKIGKYNHSEKLVIDPVVYGTYLGGNAGWDDVRAVVTDSNGGVYITGMTRSTDFPITAGPYFVSLAGTQNAYLTKLQGDAYNIDYSVFFGGTGIDYGQYIQLDPFGNVWIAGVTTSGTFDGATSGASSSTPAIFMVRFQQSANLILDPTTNPAAFFDPISNLAVNFPFNGTAPPLAGFQIVQNSNPTSTTPVTLVYDGNGDSHNVTTNGGSNNTYVAGDGFISRVNFLNGAFAVQASATEVVGEGLPVQVSGLAVDPQGNAYITGSVGDGTNNWDTSVTPNKFTTTPNVFTNGRLIQKNDLFARRYDPSGAITYSAVVGGSGNESTGGLDSEIDGVEYTTGSCIALDSNDNVYITGVTGSFDYPRTRGVFGEIFDGNAHDVVTKISSDFTQILYSTSLNTSGPVYPAGIAVDSSGNAYITGLCTNPVDPMFYSLSYPVPAANPPVPNGWDQAAIPTGSNSSDPVPDPSYTAPALPDDPTSEGFLMVLNPTAANLVLGTYLGGTLDEHVFGPYVDSNDDVWVPGSTCANRIYELFSTTGTPTIFEDDGGNGKQAPLPSTLITPLAFKSSDGPDKEVALDYPIFWYPGGAGYFIPVGQWIESRDGFLVKLRVGQPVVSAVTVTPSTIPGGLGSSATVNITLSSAAPAGGANVTLSIDNVAFASFSAGVALNTVTVTIPAGSTTLATAIPIYSLPVTQPETAIITADYGGSFLRSPLHVVPWLSNISIAPVSVVGGNAATGTITLSQPAPANGVTVNLSTTSGGLISFPAGSSVTVPSGQATATFTISTVGVDSTTNPTVDASVLGVTDDAALQLTPAQMTSITISPSELQGGETATGTVKLNGLPGPNFPAITLQVQGSPSGFTFTPTTLTANSFGQTNSASFTLATPPVASSTLEVVQAVIPTVPAGYGYQAQTVSTNLLVDFNQIISFAVTPLTANPGDTLTGTLTLLNAGSPTGVPVALTSSNPALITLPASVTVPGSLKSYSFAINVNNVAITQPTTVILSAILAPSAAVQDTVTINESTLSVSVSQNTVLGGTSLTGTVSLANASGVAVPAPVALTVLVSFSPSGVASVPTTVTIPAGSTSATFTINTTPQLTDQVVTMSVTIGNLSGSANFTVTAPTIQSIAFLPASGRGGHTVQCLITLDAPAPTGGALVTITSSNPRVAYLPATIMIPAGQTSYQFSVLLHFVSRPLSTTVTGTVGGTSVTTLLLVHR